MKQKAAFLDRDGVINIPIVRMGKPYPPDSLDTLALLPGVEQACHLLRAAGYLIIVVTNQPDVATGKQSHAVIEQFHAQLKEWLPIDAIYACLHQDSDRCKCRKPGIGMLLEASTQFPIDLRESVLIGDRWRDVATGQTAGCDTYFIDYGYREKQPDPPFTRVYSLHEAARLIHTRVCLGHT